MARSVGYAAGSLRKLTGRFTARRQKARSQNDIRPDIPVVHISAALGGDKEDDARMKTFTIEDLIKHNPCERYTPERVAELFAGREALTMLDVFDMDILPQDLVWVFSREGLAVTEHQQRQFTLMCVLSVLDVFESARPGDNRVRRCLDTIERYLRGEATDKELSATYSSAYSAADLAAESAWELCLIFIHEIITEEANNL